MARDRTARTRIRTLLVTSGPVDDPSGHATGALKDAIDYQGSAVAFIQLIAAMDRDGEIVRDIRGKRTYRISAAEELERIVGYPLSPSSAPSRAGADTATDLRTGTVTTDAGVVALDYDALARALVRELFSAMSAGSAVPVDAGELDAERTRMVAERDEYARRLQAASAKLDELLGAADRTDAEVTA